MLRRQVRQRKEFLLKKKVEEKEAAIFAKKGQLRNALDKGQSLPGHLRGAEGRDLRKTLDLQDEKTRHVKKSVDDEYIFRREPRVLLTTSRDPSSRLLQFTKEVKLIFPTSTRVNRGNMVVSDLVAQAKSHQVTDVVVVHEHRGKPDGMVVSHLPFGPTTYFSLSDVTLRHDLKEKLPTVSEASPHLVFHQFASQLGERVKCILSSLFPTPSPLGQRVVSFVNEQDTIRFRHHVWRDEAVDDEDHREGKNGTGKGKSGKGKGKGKGMSNEDACDESVWGDVEEELMGDPTAVKERKKLALAEVGPRFDMRLYRIELGTLEMAEVETEWVLRAHFNKQKSALA